MKNIICFYFSVVTTITIAYNHKKNIDERDKYIKKYDLKTRVHISGCSNCLTKKEYLICSEKRKQNNLKLSF
jgi:hypothetical protein